MPHLALHDLNIGFGPLCKCLESKLFLSAIRLLDLGVSLVLDPDVKPTLKSLLYLNCFLHKVCACYSTCILCSPASTSLDLHNKTCVAWANLHWSINENRIANRTSWLSEVHVCWFLDWTCRSSPRVFTIECGVGNTIWSCCRPQSIKYHVSLRDLFFDPQLTAYQSNIGVRLRTVTE